MKIIAFHLLIYTIYMFPTVVVSVGFNGACNLTKECDTNLSCHYSKKLCKSKESINCVTAADCVAGTTCSGNKCYCNVGLAIVDGSCRRLVGESCRTLPVPCVVNGECSSSSVCACKNGSLVTSEKYCGLMIGQQCNFSDAPCIANAECTPSGCTCKSGFAASSDNGTCLHLIGQQCNSSGTPCIVNAECTFSQCVCKSGFVASSDNKTCSLMIGQKCNLSDASCIANAQCTSSECACKSGFAASSDNGTCLLLIDQQCNSTGPSCIGNAECMFSQCACKSGFVASSDNTTCILLRIQVVAACNSSEQCVNGSSCQGGDCKIQDGVTCNSSNSGMCINGTTCQDIICRYLAGQTCTDGVNICVFGANCTTVNATCICDVTKFVTLDGICNSTELEQSSKDWIIVVSACASFLGVAVFAILTIVVVVKKKSSTSSNANSITPDKSVEQHGYGGLDVLEKTMGELFPDEKRSEVKILDVGAGTGNAGKRLAEMGFQNIDGLDSSEESLLIAKKKGIYKQLFHITITAELSAIPEDSYDVITMMGIVLPGHFCVDSFVEMIRLVKPGGYIVNCMRAHYIDSCRDCRDKWEPTIQRYATQGRWKILKREQYPNHYMNWDGILEVFQVC